MSVMKIVPHASLPRPIREVEVPETAVGQSSSRDSKRQPRKPNNGVEVEKEGSGDDWDHVSEEPLDRVRVLSSETNRDDEAVMNLVNLFVGEGDFVESAMCPVKETIRAEVANHDLQKEDT